MTGSAGTHSVHCFRLRCQREGGRRRACAARDLEEVYCDAQGWVQESLLLFIAVQSSRSGGVTCDKSLIRIADVRFFRRTMKQCDNDGTIRDQM